MIKKIIKLTVFSVCVVGLQNSIYAQCSPGETGAGPAPTGDIDVEPSTSNTSGNVVAAGNTVDLTAENLTDQDCNCGTAVDDSIDEETGTQWDFQSNAGGGTLSATTGSTVTYQSASTAGTDTIELKVQDAANQPNTVQDFAVFTVVNTVTISAVVPDTDTPAFNQSACPANVHGRTQHIVDTISNSTATGVDWSGYKIIELGPHGTVVVNTCGTPPANTGGTLNIGSDGTVTGWDNQYMCVFSKAQTTSGTQCGVIETTQWQYQAPSGSPVNFFQREYDYATDSTGHYDSGPQSAKNF